MIETWVKDKFSLPKWWIKHLSFWCGGGPLLPFTIIASQETLPLWIVLYNAKSAPSSNVVALAVIFNSVQLRLFQIILTPLYNLISIGKSNICLQIFFLRIVGKNRFQRVCLVKAALFSFHQRNPRGGYKDLNPNSLPPKDEHS